MVSWTKIPWPPAAPQVLFGWNSWRIHRLRFPQVEKHWQVTWLCICMIQNISGKPKWLKVAGVFKTSRFDHTAQTECRPPPFWWRVFLKTTSRMRRSAHVGGWISMDHGSWKWQWLFWQKTCKNTRLNGFCWVDFTEFLVFVVPYFCD